MVTFKKLLTKIHDRTGNEPADNSKLLSIRRKSKQSPTAENVPQSDVTRSQPKATPTSRHLSIQSVPMLSRTSLSHQSIFKDPTDHSHEVPHRKRPVSCSVLDKKRHSSTTLTDEHDERSTKVLTETPVSGHFLLPDTTKSAFLVPENAALALHDHHDDTIDLYPSSFDFPNSLKLSKVISEKEEPRCLSAFRDPDKQHVQLHQETSSELVSTHIAKTAAEMQLALVTRQLQLALKENEELKSRVQNMEEGSHMPPLTSMSESSSFSSISSGHQHQEEILKIHMRAQLGLIEFLEGEDDVSAAMARFKKQLEIDDTV